MNPVAQRSVWTDGPVGVETGTDAGPSDDPPSWATLCDAKSTALGDARRQYDALEAQVERMNATDSAKAFNVAAQALLDHECFAVARLDEPLLSFELARGVEVKQFWNDGLDMWLRTYLDFADGSDRTVWLLPTPRSIVTAEVMPDHPLASRMCPADSESTCAREVAPWTARMNRYFELWAADSKNDAPTRCEVAEDPAEPRATYERWRKCQVADQGRTQSLLPVGGLGVIDSGWLVIQGRRGHYSYCDGVVVFNLASGETYRFEVCSHRPELAGLRKAAGASPPAGGVDVQVGTVALPYLREFAWATMSGAFVQSDVIAWGGSGSELPESIAMTRVDNWNVGGVGAWSSYSSAQTTLEWAWADAAGKGHAAGDLTWPAHGSDAVSDYAARLLAIAEAGFEPGCATGKVPKWVIDAVTASASDEAGRLPTGSPVVLIIDAMRGYTKRRRCP